ncbi:MULTISPECIES: helix-turn-helix domain-containing protein [Sporomusa]|jgi:transcriptional regulator with XRE-family HTH domain|uniref:helix-turn-helix domain-containing protein n=1 Tax=Sporomusa TaxID=2375 RepID=UPI001664A290|nr:helix-turn-helix transcriptional regulator [Sporomusa sp. GT1]
MKFGDKVRYIRARFSLTIEQLAKLLNVTESYISHIENNRRQLSRDKIVMLAKKLNTPVEFFLIDDVETLEEIEQAAKVRTMLNDKNYFNYFAVVGQAMDARVSPEQLALAIEFLKLINGYRQKN